MRDMVYTRALCVVVTVLAAVGLLSGTYLAGCHKDVNSNRSEGPSVREDEPSIVIVYYFHRTVRCYSCKTIETRAADAVQRDFAAELSQGAVMWMPINLDEPGMDIFKEQFAVSGSTLVVARMRDGVCTEYKTLDKVWQLLNEPSAFREYVTSEVRQYMTRGS
jgi:hypothetical protein